MGIAAIILVLFILLALIARIVQPELIYGLRGELNEVLSNKAFLDFEAGRRSEAVSLQFNEILRADARYETRVFDKFSVLRRVQKIKELYRLNDPRRSAQASLRHDAGQKICIIELAGMVRNLARQIKPIAENNRARVMASDMLRFIAREAAHAASEPAFLDKERDIEAWYLDHPITIEQAIEMMSAVVFALSYRLQGAEPTFSGGVQPIILRTRRVEQRLRVLVRTTIESQTKSYAEAGAKFKELLGEARYREALARMDETRAKSPSLVIDFSDFLYLEDLESVILVDWPSYRDLFPSTVWLVERLRKLRESQAAVIRDVGLSETDASLVAGYCGEIEELLKKK